ncbi:HNH endonuclease [Solidesulfovibrio alcoholivorans]|uniref:HNH endonuclease n=1 Tax=Solidesulfovibrio alcoholivorans TaxID=81406 RepID=UPI0009FD0934|nr:HNH endonuclease [Solidesulfovibrio alcoholivorans]
MCKGLELLDENYCILFSALPKDTQQIKIGRSQDRICRFCGKNEKETTFKDIAHSIPEAVGNKNIITLDECDECNTFFSNNIEVHFDKVSKAYRQVGQIKGKRGVPSYRTKSKKSRIDYDNGLTIKESTEDKILTFPEDNTAIFNYEIEPYIPVAVYKTLVKMALSVMPNNDLIHFKEAIEWIKNKDHTQHFITPEIAIETFIPGPRPVDGVMVLLLKRSTNNPTVPSYLFSFGYGNLIYQIVPPTLLDCIAGLATNYTIPMIRTLFDRDWLYGEPKVRVSNLSSHDIQKGQILPIHHHYDKKIPMDPSLIKR